MAAVKILVVIPNLGRGGAQQVFRQQLNLLSKNFDVTGCVFNWDGSFEEDRNGKIISLDVPAGRTILSKIWNFVLRIERLRKIKMTLGVDITISHLEGADYINVLSRVRDKAIFWIHGTKRFDENIEGKLGIIRKGLLIPYLYRRATRIVTVSKGIADELIIDYPALNTKLTTIYNGFDTEYIIEKSKDSISDELTVLFSHSKILITHCRLSRQKNLKTLLQIFSKLCREQQVKLVIVGDGELRDELLTFCDGLSLKYWAVWESKPIGYSADVYFIGQQSNPFSYLSKASIYIMTSGWEGFPLALCEALACGLVVITTDCFTGPREIIAPEIMATQPVKEPLQTQYGVLMPLVKLNDTFSLTLWVNEIKRLLRIQNVSFPSRVGVNRIKEFEVSKSIDKTVTLIEEIVS